jgi:hypothetical protein
MNLDEAKEVMDSWGKDDRGLFAALKELYSLIENVNGKASRQEPYEDALLFEAFTCSARLRRLVDSRRGESGNKHTADRLLESLTRKLSDLLDIEGALLVESACRYGATRGPSSHFVEWSESMQAAEIRGELEEPERRQNLLEQASQWLALADRLDLLLRDCKSPQFRPLVVSSVSARLWEGLAAVELGDFERLLRKNIHHLEPLNELVAGYLTESGVQKAWSWWPEDLLTLKHPALGFLLTRGRAAVRHMRECDYCAERATVSQNLLRTIETTGTATEPVASATAWGHVLRRAREVWEEGLAAAVVRFGPGQMQPAYQSASYTPPPLEALRTVTWVAESASFGLYAYRATGRNRLSVIGKPGFNPNRLEVEAMLAGRVTAPEREDREGVVELRFPEFSVPDTCLLKISHGDEKVALCFTAERPPVQAHVEWTDELEFSLDKCLYSEALDLIEERFKQPVSAFERRELRRLLQLLLEAPGEKPGNLDSRVANLLLKL